MTMDSLFDTTPREVIGLGMDPGIAATGLCALGDRTLALTTDYRPKAQVGEDGTRLCHLEDAAREWTREYKPCVVIIEEQRNMRGFGAVQEKVFAALWMGGIRGCRDAESEDPLFLMCNPSSFKKYITGSGRAETEDVAFEIRGAWGSTHPELLTAGVDAVIAYGLARIALLVAAGQEDLPVKELR